jgi:hypothetical protein
MEAKNAVDVKNLEFSYGDRKVLEQICAAFQPGMLDKNVLRMIVSRYPKQSFCIN